LCHETKELALESIDGKRLGRLVNEVVLKNDEFGGALAAEVGKACHDLESRPPRDPVFFMASEAIHQLAVGTNPVRRRPSLSVAAGGPDENLGVEAHTKDPEVAAHVERSAIPRNQLVDPVTVKVGKFVIAGVEQPLHGLAIRLENVVPQ